MNGGFGPISFSPDYFSGSFPHPSYTGRGPVSACRLVPNCWDEPGPVTALRSQPASQALWISSPECPARMEPLQPYLDLPAIHDFDHFRPDTPRLQWDSIWPGLEPTFNFHREGYHVPSHLYGVQAHLDEIGYSFFGRPRSWDAATESTLGLDVYNTWTEPRGCLPYGEVTARVHSSSSSTDSSPSEDAYSPDASRYAVRPHAQAAPSYPSPDAAHWSQSSHGGHSFPSVSPLACNMKDLQISPDRLLDDNSTIIVEPVKPLEKLMVLPSQVPSPTDSGIGTSVDELLEEEEEAHHESDHDDEYIPPRQARHVVRSPRQPLRRARNGQQGAPTVMDPAARVSKLSHRGGPFSKTKKYSASRGSSSDAQKQFTCTFRHYGCDSRFNSKNEWKRHVASQHLQLGLYRCDIGNCRPECGKGGHNDFNRKDLFTSHLKRMHPPWAGGYDKGTKKQREEFEKNLPGIWDRCWLVKRQAPRRSCCGLCGRLFEDDDGDHRRGAGRSTSSAAAVAGGTGTAGGSSWEERMEHVGKHFEKMDWDLSQEKEDEDLTTWAIREGIVINLGPDGKWLVGHEPPSSGTTSPSRGRRSSSVRKHKREDETTVVVVAEVDDDYNDDDENHDDDDDDDEEEEEDANGEEDTGY